MKTLKISVKQVNEANESFSLSEFNAQIDVHHGTGCKKAIGTMLTEFFSFHSFYKQMDAKVGSGRLPYLIKVESNGETILDVGTLSRSLQAKFLLQNSTKSRKRFAVRVATCLEFIARESKVQTIEELIESLDWSKRG